LSKKRTILLVSFIVVSVLGMWLRHSHQQAEKRKREELFRRLATYTRPEQLAPPEPPKPTPPPDPRSTFDSTLPQESLDLVRQQVGRGFKLMEARFGDTLTTFKVSADGETVQQYLFAKHDKRLEGPQPVQLIGSGKLADSLYDPAAADLSLIPRLAREAVERAGLPDAQVTTVSLSYPLFRRAGEGPEWTVFVETGEVGKDWQYKHVTFDAKGKFKSIS